MSVAESSVAVSNDLLVAADLPVRIAARAIDTLVLVGIDITLGLVMGFGFDWLIVGSAIVLAYFTVLDVVAGATVGKFALGLRVIGPGGAKPTWRQALIREAFTVLGSVPCAGPFLAMASWIWIGMSIRSHPLRQGKHDLLAGGTRVILVPAPLR